MAWLKTMSRISRRMFGGWGIYVEDLFIAIIAFEQLFLKADDVTVPRFEALGCRRFEYEREGKVARLRAKPGDSLAVDQVILEFE